MRYSIFHSHPVPDWSKSSKALDRKDVVDRSQLDYEAHKLLREGHTIHAVLPEYQGRSRGKK